MVQPITFDKNWFLTIGEYAEEGKEYTRSFYGYSYTDYDHPVLLYEKGEIVSKQWKDLGSTQQVLRYRQQYTPYSDKPNIDMVKAGFNILYSRDDLVVKTLTKYDKAVEQYIIDNDLVVENGVYEFLDEYLSDNNIVTYLFGILLAHGKWIVKENVLYPPKLVLPLTSSLFWQKGNVEKIFERLQELKLIHSYTFHYSSTFEYCQAVFYDPIMLKQWQKWLSDTLSLAKNSASDYTRRAHEILQEYSCWKGICLDWKFDMLQILPCD